MPALDNNVVGYSVDDALLLRYSQLGLQCCSKRVNVAVDLLNPRLTKVAASLLQRVNGELVGGCSCYVVWEIRGDLAFAKDRSARRYG